MRAALVVCVLVVASVSSSGQSGIERLFDEGNLLYQREDFTGAIEKYRRIEEEGFTSVALHYNMANSYYKLGRIGSAILYYERARLLDPTDADVAANLEIANQATVDKITIPEEFALARWIRSTLYVVPLSRLIYLLGFLYLLLGLAFGVRILNRRPTLNRILRRLTLLVILLLTAVGLLAAAQWWDLRNRVEAIVMVSEISAMNQPGGDGVEVFAIHEGTKVRITQSTGEWVEIVLLDGKVGWISRDNLEII